jgi:hypothetical protein
MKLHEIPAVFSTHITLASFQDGSINLSFGTSKDGKDENAVYHSAAHLPLQIAQNLRDMLNNILATVKETQQ